MKQAKKIDNSLLIIFILLHFIFSSCSSNSQEEKIRASKAYVDFLIVQDTTDNTEKTKSQKAQILKRYSFTTESYNELMKKYSSNLEEWNSFIQLSLAYIDTLNKKEEIIKKSP